MTAGHIPVLASEVMDALSVKPGGTYLDMTVGGFGHGSMICDALDGRGVYVGLDLDADAVGRASQASRGYLNRFVLEQTHFSRFVEALSRSGIGEIDGCLIDLGVSSFQLDEGGRGFSFLKTADLDMRMDKDSGVSAYDIVNAYPREKLLHIFSEYAQERFAPAIATAIVNSRAKSPIATTTQLAGIIAGAIPRRFHKPGLHPATKCFLALRVETNNEYGPLPLTLRKVIDRLAPGGRLVAISFTSVEDRMVKNALAEKAQGCDCPRDFPVCVCGKKPEVKILTKKPVTPTAEEISRNARSRSARMRAASKLDSF